MKKQFPCGHMGKGQYCHRCRQKEDAVARMKAARADRMAVLAQARLIPGVNTGGVPQKVAEKAKFIADQILTDLNYIRFKGKRMEGDRNLISVPVGYSYRLVFRDHDRNLTAKALLSHEEYNTEIVKLRISG